MQTPVKNAKWDPKSRAKVRRQLHARRSGLTLLELMLVLALLVLIGSLIVPRLGDIFERQRLNNSAADLRLIWDDARLEAMQTGQSQVFSCNLETNQYSVKPLMLQSDALDAGAGAQIAVSGGVMETTSAGIAIAADTSELTDVDELDEKIKFISCRVAGDARAYQVAQEAQQTNVGNDLTTQNLNQQVIFYPDGSTSTAEVQIQNERGEIRAIRIRGLTGHSQIIDLLNVASDDKSKVTKE